MPGRHSTTSLSSFAASRPVATALFDSRKFETAALSTLAVWGILLLVVFAWSLMDGKAAELTALFDALRQRHPSGPSWCGLALLVVGAVVLTWLQMLQALWLGMVRSTWMMAGSLLNSFGLTALLAFSVWLMITPRYWPTVTEVLPWLAGGVAGLKSVAAVCSLRALKRRDILPRRVLWGALAAWLLLASGSFGVLYVLLPEGRTSVAALVLGIALFLPLTRLALAPLMLDANRHR